jgi:hypothetical protein
MGMNPILLIKKKCWRRQKKFDGWSTLYTSDLLEKCLTAKNKLRCGYIIYGARIRVLGITRILVLKGYGVPTCVHIGECMYVYVNICVYTICTVFRKKRVNSILLYGGFAIQNPILWINICQYEPHVCHATDYRCIDTCMRIWLVGPITCMVVVVLTKSQNRPPLE